MKKLLPLFISAALGSMCTSAWADSLAQIYDLAKQNDPQLLSEAAKRDQLFEAVNSSRSVLLPQINLTAGYNITRGGDKKDPGKSKVPTDSSVTSAGIGFTQDLFNRASWVALDTAEKTARQEDATYSAAQQDLILRVSQAYFNVLRAKDKLAFVRAEKSAVGRQLEQTKQRFEVGLSAITDVHDAKANYDAVLADEIAAQNDLNNSYESLREITGQEHKNLNTLDTKRFSTSKPDDSVDALVNKAKTNNLSLLAARIGQDIARDYISLATSGHLPTLSLSGGYDYSDTRDTYKSGANERKDGFNVGINLAVPLYTGGNTTSNVKQAQYAYVAASENLEKAYRSVVKDVRAQNNNINASIGSVKAYEQSVISAKSALEATEAGFQVGTRTIVDVLDSTKALYDAQQKLSDARYNYIIAGLKLRQAMGTLSEQDILDIDAGLTATKTAAAKS